MTKRKLGGLIACIAVVVALGVGIAVLMLFPEQEHDNGSDELELQSDETLRTLVSEQSDDVLEVIFTPLEGAPYTIRRNAYSEEIELELIAEDTVFSGDAGFMRTAFSMAISLTNLTLVTEDADDAQLAVFGLDYPVMTWEVRLIDGSVKRFMIGDMQIIGEGRYVRLYDSREVFMLNEWQSRLLTQSMEDMYDLSFFPLPPATPDMQTWIEIEHFMLEFEDGRVIEVQRRDIGENAEVDEVFVPAAFEVLQPHSGIANDHNVQTILLEPITHIAPERVIETNPADLSVYGLDAPAKLTVTTDEWRGTLLIGSRSAEHGGQYVMLEGYDAVLLDMRGSYPFLEVDPAHLLSRLIWLHNIVDVDSVEFVLEGRERILRFEHDFDNETLIAWLDDEELSDRNARRLYIGVISIGLDGSTDADIPAVPPAYRFTINTLDGHSDTMELYSLNETQFLMVRNGENTGFFITRMALHQNLLMRFDILDDGGDIP